MRSIKHTPLNGIHRGLGARMIEFGGFEMPLSYSGIIEEHLAVRTTVGIFDLSHMGEFHISGPGALPLLEHALTNSAARLVDNQAQYTLMCAEDGGTIDDLIVYRLSADHYMLCVNASNIATDRGWLTGFARSQVDFRDASEETALVAVQGPRSEEILRRVTSLPLGSIGRFRMRSGEIAGVQSLAARTGYTGEDGFEIFVASNDAERLFTTILEAGAADDLKPCGLGARDTLRMEAGLPLYGHELDRATSPLEAGLEHFVKFGRGFMGEAAIAAKRGSGTQRRLVGLRTDDGKSIARQGYKIYHEGGEIGVVTSGTFAPSFNRPLAMGYIGASLEVRADEAARLEVEIRGRMAPASIVPLPFYRRERARSHS